MDRINISIDEKILFLQNCASEWNFRKLPDSEIKWIDQKNIDKSTERWLDYIFSNLSFEKWYCAHYHGDKTIDKMRILYKGYCKLGE